MFREKWLEMIPEFELDIDERYYEKIADYLDIHSDFEVINKISPDNSTIHLAVKTLSKLNLDKIEFIKLCDEVKTNVVRFDFKKLLDGGLSKDVITGEINNAMVNGVSKMLEEILKTNKLKIFMLFSQITGEDGGFMVFNRFYIEKGA